MKFHSTKASAATNSQSSMKTKTPKNKMQTKRSKDSFSTAWIPPKTLKSSNRLSSLCISLHTPVQCRLRSNSNSCTIRIRDVTLRINLIATTCILLRPLKCKNTSQSTLRNTCAIFGASLYTKLKIKMCRFS